MMKTVYICSPYRGNVKENVERAKRLARNAALEGCLVIAPHLLYPQFLDDGNASEREIGLNSGLKLLEFCDEVRVAEGDISHGMSREIARAGELGIPMVSVEDPLAAEERLLKAVLSG